LKPANVVHVVRFVVDMSLNDEQADILGGPLLQKPHTGLLAVLQYSPAFKGGALFLLGLLAWVAFVRVREYIRRNRDLNYRKYAVHLCFLFFPR